MLFGLDRIEKRCKCQSWAKKNNGQTFKGIIANNLSEILLIV